ncbi:MAG: C-type lectin domain-containing protein [Polyangiaceae bacterium]|nr:C-type lectin domain-containing protein [Polyangiaceae bacterium]
MILRWGARLTFALLVVSGCSASDLSDLRGDNQGTGGTRSGGTGVGTGDAGLPDSSGDAETGTGGDAGTGPGPICTDNLQNGFETDRDCGGVDCDPCAVGSRCVLATDCANDSCIQGQCQSAECVNGVLDDTTNEETDIDCGGTQCGPCEVTQICLVAGDCLSSICTDGTCRAPACNDGLSNGSETDLDCGGGSCEPCDDDLNCALPSDCRSGTCDAGTCGGAVCSDGVKNGVETDVDCGGVECPKCDLGFACEEDGANCLSELCMADTSNNWTCVAAGCGDGMFNGDESDEDCGGSCSKCDTDKRCSTGGDCQSAICFNNVCLAPACDDSILNSDESDIDCGGIESGCDRCLLDEACTNGGDCGEGVCDAATGLCAAPVCDDNVINGGETDQDCGGSTTCDRCDLGQSCIEVGDCEADRLCLGTCANLTCQNFQIDEGESDVDCGGVECPKCIDGNTCTESNDCLSGVCEDPGGGQTLCQTPTCNDGITNQDETDTDCGGSCTAECDVGSPCLDNSDCVSGVCFGQLCLLASCGDGVQNGPSPENQESDVDCGAICGSEQKLCTEGKSCVAGNDCNDSVCEGTTCSAPTCGDGAQNSQETDIDCGGNCGSTCELSEACQGDGDCLSNVCANGFCTNLGCSDGNLNGQETDLDCGGPGCGPTCTEGLKCLGHNDCVSLRCVPTNGQSPAGLCAAPTCFDSTQNQGESHADCGGTSDCQRCSAGSTCAADSDCASLVCDESNTECLAPACAPGDGVINGDETDRDCGGTGCPTCSDGESCDSNSDCNSGVCNGSNSCEPPICGDQVSNDLETGIDCGGPINQCATRCGDGENCDNNSDCVDLVCQGNSCRVSTCDDSTANGLETGVDCGGGSPCAKCGVGQACNTEVDCLPDLACSTETSTCADASCTDGFENNDETDVDCGGSCPANCADGAGCISDNDCINNICQGDICQVPGCGDGRKNQDESDIDCGGATCDGCGDGDICSIDNDCTAGAICASFTCCRPDSCASEGWTCDSVNRGCGLAAEDCGSCSDGNTCTSDDCNAGTCAYPADNGASCTDGVSCTDDECVATNCISTNNCATGDCISPPGVCGVEFDLYFNAEDSFGGTGSGDDTHTSDAVALWKMMVQDITSETTAFNGRPLFDVGGFDSDEELDAFAVLTDGNFVLSTIETANFDGSPSFEDGDLMEWNGSTDTKFFDASTYFTNDIDIDAVHVFGDDGFLFSTTENMNIPAEYAIGGSAITYGGNDLVLFRGGKFSLEINDTDLGGANIDGVSIHPISGHILLSFADTETTVGGVAIYDEDIVELGWAFGETPNHTETQIFFAGRQTTFMGGGLVDYGTDTKAFAIGYQCTNNASCDDFIDCTTGDICTNNVCAGSVDNSRCDDSNVCTSNTCDVLAGCTFPASNEGGSCDDGVACSADSCVTGTCVGVSDCVQAGYTCDFASGICVECAADELIYNNTCYFYSTSGRNHTEAQDYCTGLTDTRVGTWTLAYSNDTAENDFIRSAISSPTWLVGRDSSSEGNWVDLQGAAMSYNGAAPLPWGSSQPDNGGGGLFSDDEDCISMHTDAGGPWYDDACGDDYHAFCEQQ